LQLIIYINKEYSAKHGKKLAQKEASSSKLHTCYTFQ